MTAYTKVAGAWRTVSQPYFKLSGIWKTGAAMHTRVGWPQRYASMLFTPRVMNSATFWTIPAYVGNATTGCTATAEAGPAIRLKWDLADGTKFSHQAFTMNVPNNKEITFSITCTEAPAGVPWQVKVGNWLGNLVTGPGTSTVVFTYASTYGTTFSAGIYAIGPILATDPGHKITSVSATLTSPSGGAPANVKMATPWKQAWPAAGTGAPQAWGLRKPFWVDAGYSSTYQYIQYTQSIMEHFLNNRFVLPLVPYYEVKGDPSTIASAKVTLRFTPVAPKSPVEHTISWEAPVGWGIYHVGWLKDDNTTAFYYAALTDAEAAALRTDPTRWVTTMWTPKEGGYFCYMPVCWDASGVTVPMRTDDPYSGYGNFPPNRTATSALADYTVENGYSDMGSGSLAYTAITIELKNSGGTVIHTLSGSLASGIFKDSPGKGIAPVALDARDVPDPVSPQPFYWPVEWRSMFDYIGIMNPAYTVAWNEDKLKGDGEWYVFDAEGTKVGDFRLAMRYGHPGIIEITGVNLAPTLLGQKIMRHVVEHGVEYCPTEDIIVMTGDELTYDVMQTWGWRPLSDLSALSLAALPQEYQENIGRCLFNWSDPMYNRFRDLGLPAWQEVTR